MSSSAMVFMGFGLLMVSLSRRYSICIGEVKGYSENMIFFEVDFGNFSARLWEIFKGKALLKLICFF